MPAPLGPAFRRLFVASSASNLADGITRVVLPLLAARLTRDPVLVAVLTTLAFLPWLLFALPAGAVVDRVDRRRAMAAANAVRAFGLGALGVTALAGTATLAVLYVVAFGIGVAETFYDSAARAMLPQVVRRDQLDRGNGLLTVGETASETFLGAPVGAALFAVAVAAPFLTTAAAYALAAVVVCTIAGRHRPDRTESGARTSIRRDVAEGVGWLWRHRFLRGLTLVSATTSGLQSLTTGVTVLWALDVLDVGEAGFGLLLTASGLGAVVGGLVAARLAARLGRTTVLVAGAVLAALATAAAGLTTDRYVAGVLLAVGAAAVMFWNVLTHVAAPGADPRGALRSGPGRLPHAGVGRDPRRLAARRAARRRDHRADRVRGRRVRSAGGGADVVATAGEAPGRRPRCVCGTCARSCGLIIGVWLPDTPSGAAIRRCSRAGVGAHRPAAHLQRRRTPPAPAVGRTPRHIPDAIGLPAFPVRRSSRLK
ncbi:Fucose permease [Modestobacter sp. DSM 44400]|uniref:MFS transporter n=1 Tax=Modestobacter sp. DSM 44400 TaxID=1550230 RepID=UPI0008998EEC|nr:MFS transporter [Modestobacter sp. DSM 44400]SDY76332.1 Fucose permease [Modestobacter sp. DSM 44400]